MIHEYHRTLITTEYQFHSDKHAIAKYQYERTESDNIHQCC